MFLVETSSILYCMGQVYLDMTRRPQLVFDRPGVPRRSFGNPASASGTSSGAASGANSKRDPLPPPSYSEVEGLDLPDYRDLEFADENFKLYQEDDKEVVVVRRKADVVDNEIERGDGYLQREAAGGEGIGVGEEEEEDVGEGVISQERRRRFDQETEEEQRGTLRRPKMNTTEKSGEVDETSRRSIYVEMDEAKNQVVDSEQVALVDQPEVLELEDNGELKQMAIGRLDGKRKQKESKRKHTEIGNEEEEERLDGIGTDKKEEMRGEEKEAYARGDDCEEERIEMRREGGKKEKENGVGGMEGNLTRKGTVVGGENMRDATEEKKEEHVRSEAGEGEEKEERREMKEVGDKEKEKKEDSVPPLWDTVLVQNGDARGTQV